ncbi:MAG: recombinase family protein [Alphaproteobacteria bacterium]
MAKKLNFDPYEKCTQAIVFARVSSKKQKDKGVSLDVQMETITQYCIDNGLKIVKDLSIDESSTKGERKQYHEMLDFAKSCAGKVAIIVNYVDRLQRSYDDTYELNKLRKEGKIEIHFLKEDLIITKDSAAMDLTFWNMHVLMANFQVNTMIDKVKASQKQNWADGKWQGLAPIGYLNTRDEDRKATLIIDTERAPIIKILFEEYATGLHSLQSLWYKARELGLTSKEKNHYEKSPKFGKRTFISRNKIEDILKNPFYYGMMKVKGNLLPHIYEPIISKALFDKVQEVFQSKSRDVFSHQQEYKAIQFAFRGLITCKCGCAITPEHHKKGNKEYVYLRCSHQKGSCNQKLVNENTILEQLDREIFHQIRISPTIYDLLKTSITQSLEDEKKINASIRKKIAEEISLIDTRLERLWECYLDQDIDKAKYELEKQKYLEQKKDLNARAEKYSDISNGLKENVGKAIDFAANLSNLMNKSSSDEKNMLLRRLLTNCILDNGVLKYEIKAPFDKLLSCTNYKKWKDIAIENLEEFENIKIKTQFNIF